MAFYRVDDVESYNDLTDKPQINGVTLTGNKTTANLSISYNNLTNRPQINGVTLTGNKTTANLSISYEDTINKPQINGVTITGNKTAADFLISAWSDSITLSEGTEEVTFTGLTSTYAYDLYSETADGTPVFIKDYLVSGNTITYTLAKAITSDQAGLSGTGCKVKLKCLF